MMENQPQKHGKSRLLGKLFTKEKKPVTTDEDVADFLRLSPSDALPAHASITAARPTPPVRIDTASARRWPTAAEIKATRDSSPESTHRRKRPGKGLSVRFCECPPELIGEGGDEAELPVVEISKNRIPRGQALDVTASEKSGGEDVFRPPRRTQTGFSSLEDERRDSDESIPPVPTQKADPSSFASRMQHAEMRAAEGKAFRNSYIEPQRPPSQSPAPTPPSSSTASLSRLRTAAAGITKQRHVLESSPASVRSTQDRPSSRDAREPDPLSTRQFSFKDAALAVAEDAFDDFTARMQYKYTFFDLSAQAARDMSAVTVDQLVAAAAWWFLRGRLSLESTMREPPNSEAEQRAVLLRQQAHTDLAKAVWIVREKLPAFEDMGPGKTPAETIAAHRANGQNAQATLVEYVQSLTSSLRKLAMSMKRNNVFPPTPDEAPLQQGIDPSIWVEALSLPLDVAALLGGTPAGSRASAGETLPVARTFPLSDSVDSFHYGRVFAEAVLVDVGQESGSFRWPCVVSIGRGVQDKMLTFVAASQDGIMQLRIQSNKTQGPTWEDVKWHARASTMEVKLPRGFVLQLRCAPPDFQYAFGLFDYANRIYFNFHPLDDEAIVFEMVVKAFQCLDGAPQSNAFVKQPVPKCRLRLFEQKSPPGTPRRHTGFRLCVITSPQTKTLSGFNQDVPLTRPILFGFLRGEGGDAALLLKIDDGRRNATMIIAFDDPAQRSALQTILSGNALQPDETVYTQVALKSFSISFPPAPAAATLDAFSWQNLAVVNRGDNGASAQDADIVFSDALRIVIDAKEGTMTDRVNFGRGGVKLCLSTNPNNFEIKLLRSPQQELTMIVADAQLPPDHPAHLREIIHAAATTDSVRSFKFFSLTDLHAFQAAVTGYQVVYDGIVSTFAINRRIIVVSIHKKWEATSSRIQILRRDRVVQLAVFFEGFSHGRCMNFVVKSTDVFESSKSGGKYHIKIVDAKFALPNGGEDREASIDDNFVCLDLPEYPSEHDDLTISFDGEAERDKFAQFLPAPVKAGFRIGGLKK